MPFCSLVQYTYELMNDITFTLDCIIKTPHEREAHVAYAYRERASSTALLQVIVSWISESGSHACHGFTISWTRTGFTELYFKNICSSEIYVFLNKGHITAMDNWFLVLVSPY